MQRVPTILTIAGSDCSGGAGIQADLKAIAATGGYGASVITAITAQNTQGVRRVEPLALELVAAQLDAVFDDLDVVAVKTGMLATAPLIRLVAEHLRRRAPKSIVIDPVMVSTSGHRLLEPDAVAAIESELFPLATVITPNLDEAAVLDGRALVTLADAEAAGRRLVGRGARAVLMKGGHLAGARGTDLLVTAAGVQTFAAPTIDTRHGHGTGCTYAAAIASQLGRGARLGVAVAVAKEYLHAALVHGLAVGHGAGPVDHFFYQRQDVDGAAWLARFAR